MHILGQNIAFGQLATQSGTLGDFYPHLAVDGDHEDSCSFTPRTADTRWWQVWGLDLASGLATIIMDIYRFS